MRASTIGIREQSRMLRLLLSCGVVGPLFFIIVFLIEGATRADYDPLRHPVSSLALGELGWMQAANFVILGLLLLAFAIGLRLSLRPSSLWGPLLIGLVGIGLIGSGIFVTDPVNGYPPGTPLKLTEYSDNGFLHDVFGVPIFLVLPITCLVFARRFAKLGDRNWAVYSGLSGIAMFAFFVLAGMGFDQQPGLAEFAGVYQRLSLISGLGWIMLLAVHLLRAPDFGTMSQS